jgi:hypothetical protein
MKALRLVLSATLLAVLGTSLIPTPSRCQMMDGALLTQGGQLASCKVKLSIRHWPLFRTAATEGGLANSVRILESIIQPLHHGGLTFPGARFASTLVSDYVGAVSLFFSEPVSPVRLPPTDTHLFNA